MLRWMMAAVGIGLLSTSAGADSTTSCRRTIMGHFNCDTTTWSDDRATIQSGLNNLATAIAIRNARKQGEAQELPAPLPEPPLVDLATGNGFVAGCADPASAANFGLCYGFIRGLLQREFMYGSSPICIPDGVTVKQLIDVAVAFVNQHPQDRHLWPGLLGITAYRQAFPCKNQSP